MTLRQEAEWILRATIWGDQIDHSKMPLKLDVKAVTYHLFALEETTDGWKAMVVLDI
ncbi:MAG: archease [Candidatus Methylomirabilales bacterium]